MKKIFIPSIDELYQMQEMGANVYKYILVKAIESLICHGVNYPKAEILKVAYKYLKDNIEISRAICTLYPEEMKYSKISKIDTELCLRLINSKTHDKNCGLDYLSKFDTDVLENSIVLTNVVQLLNKELIDNAKYRFDYNSNKLLDSIFNREIGENELMLIFGESKNKVTKALTNIEPTYALSLPDNCFTKETRREHLHTGIHNYANRYGITASVGIEYTGKDILTNKEQDVKRLLRCIKDRNK